MRSSTVSLSTSDDLRGDALVWLGYALGDLELARAQPGRSMRPRHVAFQAQQAAEKPIKAALVLEGIEVPRTHDLDVLRKLLPRRWRVVSRPASLARLSDYAADTRYPDSIISVNAIQSATAVRQANAVVRLVREDFGRRGVMTEGLQAR
jgi:HEPN domain-containing protein